MKNIAQSPRIVVGPITIGYLNAHLKEEIDEANKFALYNRSLAEICLNMIAVDQDGHHVLDYLGNTFTTTVVREQKAILYKHACSFVCNEYMKHFRNQNSKLAARYAWLKGYYGQNSLENFT